MTKWLLLAVAILAEVTATLSLRAAADHSAWYALVAVGYVSAFVMLAQVLTRGLPIGIAYGIWAASGVALTAVLATFLFDDSLTLVMAAGIALVICGVVLVETDSSHTSPSPTETA